MKSHVVFQLDDKGIITFISKRIEEITGYESDELIGKNISEIVYKDDLDKVELIKERRTGNRAIRRLELRLKGKKGIKYIETRWIGVNATGLYLPGITRIYYPDKHRNLYWQQYRKACRLKSRCSPEYISHQPALIILQLYFLR